MKIGCCTNMFATEKDTIGMGGIETLKRIGYDYVELPIAPIIDLPKNDFNKLKGVLDACGMRCEVFNLLFPAEIRLTGDKVNRSVISDHLKKVVDIAEQLDTKVIIYGSGPARNVPEGFSKDKAWQQLVEILQEFDEMADSYGITLAVEPYNKKESNIINSTLDGLKLAKDSHGKNAKIVIDYFHSALEKEDADVVLTANEYVSHIHISRPEGRRFVKETDNENYLPFLNNLKKIGYDSRISVEAFTDDLKIDAIQSLAFLRKVFFKNMV